MKKILIACEESQAVTKAFRKLGFEAYSCDLLPCSGGHPEWHYQQDVFEVIDKGWDLIIKKYNTTLERSDLSTLEWLQHAQEEAMDFVLYLERLKQEYKLNK
jgi:hypothetical protein